MPPVILRIYTAGTIFVQIVMGLNMFIPSQGFAQVGIKTTIIGAVCNIVLDPVFIFLFDMGVQVRRIGDHHFSSGLRRLGLGVFNR